MTIYLKLITALNTHVVITLYSEIISVDNTTTIMKCKRKKVFKIRVDGAGVIIQL